MEIDFRKLCEEFNIEIAPVGYTCTREGWTNISCPFCDDQGYRMGFNDSFHYFTCFRCGSHSIPATIAKLLGTGGQKTYKILEDYKGKGRGTLPPLIKKHAESCELPVGTTTMKKPHCDYLRSRGFSPRKLADLWGVKGTTGVGSYSNRIIIPIYINGNLVSYQGRDITGDSQLRYKACPSSQEVIEHKDIVYGFDKALPYKQCVVTEGALDVWRLGYGAVCTFGIKWTEAQMRLLAQNFKKVYIMFDKEEQANSQAEKLEAELLFRGIDCELVDELPEGKDPGELEQKEGDRIMKKLGFIQWKN